MRYLFVTYIRIFSFLLGIFLFFPFVSFAQSSNNPAADTQIWIHLRKTEQVIQNGRIFMELTTGVDHNQKNVPTYIIECLDTTDDRVCSTGTIQGDSIIYQSDTNLKKMQTLYHYEYRGMLGLDGKPVQNPVTTNQNGEIPPLLWESVIQGDVVRKFYGVNLVKEDPGVTDNLETISSGNEGGQQQGSFKIKMSTPTPKPQAPPTSSPPPPPSQDEDKGQGDCCQGSAGDSSKDPYGRVFDAVSLEPIPNARVNLLVQRTNGSFSFMSPKETINAIINPWTTKEDGKFVFMVRPGVYRLEINLPNHTFPFNSKDLNPNYTKAYYELYYEPGFTDQNIVEINTIEHRDIPVIPKGEAYHGQVTLLGYMSKLDKKQEVYEVIGRTSHPLTIVEIQGKAIDTDTTTRTLAKVTASKWGFFNATVATSILETNETVGFAKMTKVDLTAQPQPISQKKSFSSFISRLLKFFPYTSSFAKKEKPKTPQSTLARINPLLNYLEGYAYDSNNKPIPNAKVHIYLSGSKKSYYETKADEKGYYVITSQHLPFMNYLIVYTNPEGKTYEITQSKFLFQNLKTIVSKGINVHTYLTRVLPFHISAQERTQLGEKNKSNPSPSVEKVTTNNFSQNNTVVLTIIFIFLILLAGITGIIWYVKKKQQPPSLSP